MFLDNHIDFQYLYKYNYIYTNIAFHLKQKIKKYMNRLINVGYELNLINVYTCIYIFIIEFGLVFEYTNFLGIE